MIALTEELRVAQDRSRELEQHRDNQQHETDDLHIQLNSSHEQIARLVAAREQERATVERLQANVRQKSAEIEKLMADATGGISDAKRRMEQAEQRISEYRSRPWWRRMFGRP